jgi:hypothetical protein
MNFFSSTSNGRSCSTTPSGCSAWRCRHAALGHQQVAAEGGVAVAQAVLFGHLGDQAAAGEGRLALEPIWRAPSGRRRAGRPMQISTMACARPGSRSCWRRPLRATIHGAGCRASAAAPSSPGRQGLAHARQRRLGRSASVGLGLVGKACRLLFADVFLVLAQSAEGSWACCGDAQAGAEHQEGQDQQEPPGAVDRVQAAARRTPRPRRGRTG